MKNKEITIQKEISPIVAQVESMSIATPEDMTEATSLLSRINKYADALKKDKDLIVKPINLALKEIRDKYRPVETMLDTAVTTLKKKMGTYQSLMLAEQKKLEEKIASKVASGYIKIDTAIKKLGDIDAPETKVATDDGSVSFRLVKKFEVMDCVILANHEGGKYVLPNDTAIREALKTGVELPGVRYYEEQQVINRR